MEADDLAGMVREWVDSAHENMYAYHQELMNSTTATANEDTAFYLVVDGERFLVSVAKVGE